MKRILLVAVLMAGCTDGTSDPARGDAPAPEPACWFDGEQVYYFGPGHALQPDHPDDGATPGNGFAEAFLTNELEEWTFQANQTFRIIGNVTLEFWSQGNQMPAPIMIGGAVGEGYHFFNQFGSNRGFVESYAIEYASALGDTELRHYVEVFEMPPGGLPVEANDAVRMLLTNLVLDDAEGAGPDILWGGKTPSQIRFTSICEPTPTWQTLLDESFDVSVPAHQGLLTGAVPEQEGVNFVDVPFVLDDDTQRLTIMMTQDPTANPVKSDMDLTVHAAGQQVWSIGSPYTDEIGTAWQQQLAADMPHGEYVVRVNSYSGHAYEGVVRIIQETS